MAAATTAASLAARVAPHAAPGAARRGARVARRAPLSRPGARRSPSVVRAQDDGEGGPPASQGPGGFSGSRLIVPGMEGFDSSYGDVNPNARSIPTPSQPGGRGGPPGDPRLADKPGSFPAGTTRLPSPGRRREKARRLRRSARPASTSMLWTVTF